MKRSSFESHRLNRSLKQACPTVLLIVGLFGALNGCSPETTKPIAQPFANKIASGSERRVRPIEPRFDLGTVIAKNQTLTHEFALRNLTDRPVRSLSAFALTPCCSEVSRLPEQILPFETAKVEVKWRVNFQSGPKQVEFRLTTDDGSPSIELFLLADLKRQWQINCVEKKPLVLKLCQGVKLFYDFDYLLDNPEKITVSSLAASDGLSVSSVGEPAFNEAGGIIKVSQRFTVDISPNQVPGFKRGSTLLSLSNGEKIEHSILWEVRGYPVTACGFFG